jgi:hypothetical protein
MCAVLSFSFSLTNCEVEDEITTTAENKSSSVSNTPDLISFTIQGAQNQTEVITMLKFASWEHFDSTANQLSEELEIYDDAFLAANESLGEEELDEFKFTSGYNDQVPQINFENSLEFTNPLRIPFNAMNEAYMEGNLEGTSPYASFAWSGSELSLINNRQRVAIGNEIFQTMDDGYVSFTQDHVENLSLLAQNNLDALKDKEGVTVNVSKALDCRFWKASKYQDEISSDRRVDLVAKIRSVPLYSKQEKMSISYKHRRGRMRERRTHMSVNIVSTLYSTSCGSDPVNRSKAHNTYKKKRRRDIKTTVWGGGLVYAPNLTGIKGEHRHYTAPHPTYSLQW